MTVTAPVDHWSSRLHGDVQFTETADGDRFPPPNAEPLTVTVECPAGSVESGYVGEVLDLSKSGAKLLLTKCLPLHELITLHVRDAAGTVSLSVTATVCWSRQSTADKWRIGCSFGEELPAERIHELAAAGYLERREHERLPVAGDITVQWQLDANAAPALLEDISTGGFCMVCQEVGRVRDRVRLIAHDSPENRHSVMATVRWQARVHDGYLVGCEFVESRSYEVLRECIARTKELAVDSTSSPAKSEPAARRPRARIFRWALTLSAACLATFVGWAALPANLLVGTVSVAVASLIGLQVWSESNVR